MNNDERELTNSSSEEWRYRYFDMNNVINCSVKTQRVRDPGSITDVNAPILLLSVNAMNINMNIIYKSIEIGFLLQHKM